MTKIAKPIWVCTDCGDEASQWAGRCPNCGAWDTLKEVRLPAAAGLTGRSDKRTRADQIPAVMTLSAAGSAVTQERVSSGLGEIDRVLGGGFLPGTVALMIGEPGVGKSTLLLRLADTVSRSRPVLYISGEESTTQIQHRAERLGILPSPLRLVALTDLDALLTTLATEQVQFAVVDSIQTIVDARYPSAAGSVVQVRESALALQRWAKTTGATLVLVGHVTKDGVVAGPRTLEHLVDVVIALEGDRLSDLRLVRTSKNRFGPTDEVGILAMTTTGLEAVDNPSARFLSEQTERVPGSITTVILEGTRPLLVEIQALTRRTTSPYPRRTASGFDQNRLELLLAVLEARAGIRLDQLDCYVNVSGGLRLREPAADLAVILAIASAALNKTIPPQTVAFGEIGLAGEIRRVPQMERRAAEARRLGYDRLLSAATVREAVTALSQSPPVRLRRASTSSKSVTERGE